MLAQSFDLINAFSIARIAALALLVIAALLGVGAWRRKRWMVILSAVLLISLVGLLQPWSFLPAFEDPGELPAWDESTLLYNSIFKTLFIAIVTFCVIYVFAFFKTAKRWRRCHS